MSPVIVAGDEVTVNVSPVGETFTIYPVIAEPFAVAPPNETTALRSPAIAVTEVGAVGAPAGTTEEDTVAGELPTLFRATALKV